MSGHLLHTVNPRAAAESFHDGREPKIGEILHFFPRYGEGRGGKSVFPAMVLGVNSGECELLVFFDTDDLCPVKHSVRKTVQNNQHVWDFIDHTPPASFPGADLALQDQLARMQHQIDDLQGQLALMKAPGAPPPVSRKRG